MYFDFKLIIIEYQSWFSICMGVALNTHAYKMD